MWNNEFTSKDDLQVTDFVEERNQQSLEYFYDKYSPALYGIIHRITNNKHLANDCLVTTFEKAWNEIGTFPLSGISFFAWLLGIARQTAFEVVTLEKEKNSGSHNFVYGRDQHLTAFELVYIKGLSVVQAAELSGITVTELRTNIRMDLQNMKDKK